MLDSLLNNSIFFLFLSYTAGLIVDQTLRRTINYPKLSNFQLFKTPQAYERLGILPFKRAITPFTMNAGLKDGIKSKDISYLKEIRDHMTAGEIGHWVAAIFLFGVTLVAVWKGKSPLVVFGYVILNLFGNVYLSLLQQYNKLRLDRILQFAEQAKTSSERQCDTFKEDKN